MSEPLPTVESDALSKRHREILVMIADRTRPAAFGLTDPGWTASSSTFADPYNVFVHWRTARALHSRGLIEYPYKGGYDEGWSIALTEAGWAAIGREPIRVTSSGSGDPS